MGGAGGDWLSGGSGDDSISGGAGDDHLYGGAGADYLEGGTGDDTLIGGAGVDHYSIGLNQGHDIIDDQGLAGEDDVLRIYGGDTLTTLSDIDLTAQGTNLLVQGHDLAGDLVLDVTIEHMDSDAGRVEKLELYVGDDDSNPLTTSLTDAWAAGQASTPPPPAAFSDDFNRADGPVANGWQSFPGSVGSDLLIANGAVTEPIAGGSAGIYHSFDFSQLVSASLTLTPLSGYGGLLDRYSTTLLFGSDDQGDGGVGLSIGRGDQNYADSSVSLVYGGVTLATIGSSFQFDSSIQVSATLGLDGDLHGFITGSGQRFDFDFGARTLPLAGDNFGIVQNGPDDRASPSAIVYPTIDNVTLSHAAPDDFFPSSPATNGVLGIGQTIHGAIEQPSDTDWFAVNLSAGATYAFTLTGAYSGGGTLADPFLRIRDSDGHSLAANDDVVPGDLDAALSFTAPSDGTYYVSVGGDLVTGGTYTLSAAELSSGGGASGGPGVQLTGGALDDTLLGTGGNDQLVGNGGDDVLIAYGGADYLDGGAGNDRLYGGAGNDTLYGGGAADTLYGGSGDDTISDSGSGSTIDGGSGNDTLTLDRSNLNIATTLDVQASSNGVVQTLPDGTSFVNIENLNLYSGLGDDDLNVGAVTGYDYWSAGDGTDHLTADFSAETSQLVVRQDIYNYYYGYRPGTAVAGGDEVDFSHVENLTISGGSGNDSFTGGDGTNIFTGNGGDDGFYGGVGNDTFYGGAGNDTLYGGGGADTLYGGSGDDTISDSGSGSTIDGGSGNDTLTLDRSNLTVDTTLDVQASSNGVVQTLPDGTSFVNIENLNLYSGLGDDDLNVGAVTGYDYWSAGDGTDHLTADFSAETSQLVVRQDIYNYYYGYRPGTAVAGGDEVDFSHVENLTISGGSGNDSFTGGDGTNVFTGNGGDDAMSGGAGNDTFYGGAGNDYLYGGGGNDTLDGGAGDDYLDGGSGIDSASYASATSAVTVSLAAVGAQNTLGAGVDTLVNIENLIGSNFNDTLTGDANDNVLEGGLGNDTLNGGLGSDTASYAGAASGVKVSLLLTAAQNTLGAGTDTLVSIENLRGSAFNDTLTGDAGANVIEGGGGNDTMDGGAGIDTVSYEHAASAVTVSLALTTAQNTGGAGTDTLKNFENLTGSAFNDVLTGSTAANVLSGLGGDDVLNGGKGNDILDGGAGVDTASYADATAKVTVNLSTGLSSGGGGTDTPISIENVVGSAFDDTLYGNAGDNVLDGGAGTDLASYAPATAGVTVRLALTSAQNTGGAGTDTLLHIENLTGSAFNDTLGGTAGDNVMDGGAGIDTVTYQDATAGVTVSLATTAAQNTGGAGTDTLKNFENLTGSDFADTLTGSTAANVLIGGAGDDHLYGGAGNDTLDGGLGADLMDGGAGNDTFLVDNAGDVVIEAANGGTDTVIATLGGYTLTANVENLVNGGSGDFIGTGNALANTLTGGAGSDTLYGLAGNDKLYGGDGADHLYGGDGNDTLDGGAGDDVLDGGQGNDTYMVDSSGDVIVEALNAGTDTVNSTANSYTLSDNVEILNFVGVGDFVGTGSAGADTINGGAGNDTLSGMAGADKLIGGDGNDTLIGGAGADTLTGGLGADAFVYKLLSDSSGSGVDTIVDFSSAQGDYIDLSAIDANSVLAGDQAFSFIGSASYGHHAGELRYTVSGAVLTVHGDVNGDGVDDFLIKMSNLASLSAGDFHL